jgi:putative membrane protein
MDEKRRPVRLSEPNVRRYAAYLLLEPDGMRTRLFLAAPSVLLLLACGSEPPPSAPDNPPPPVPSSAVATGGGPGDAVGISSSPLTPDAGAPMSTGGTPTTVSNPAAPAPIDLTDDQILMVTHTANQGEIDQAQLVPSRCKDARVRMLAAMMLTDHKAADAAGVALVTKDHLNPAASAISISLDGDASSATTSLKSLKGGEFDASYVDTQVKEHQTVLELLDQKLIPTAESTDVKAYLADVRPKIALHLQHAQDLQKAMRQ